jgi:hypothetical protein
VVGASRSRASLVPGIELGLEDQTGGLSIDGPAPALASRR